MFLCAFLQYHTFASGTKAAAYHVLRVPGGQSAVIKLRMYAKDEAPKQESSKKSTKSKNSSSDSFGRGFDEIFAQRIREKDRFYAGVVSPLLVPEEVNICA